MYAMLLYLRTMLWQVESVLVSEAARQSKAQARRRRRQPQRRQEEDELIKQAVATYNNASPSHQQ